MISFRICAVLVIYTLIGSGHTACVGYRPVFFGNDESFKFSASSIKGNNEPSLSTFGTASSWVPTPEDQDTAWIEVELDTRRIGGIVTMGKGNREYFVSAYSVMYKASMDDQWAYATVDGKQVLNGNRKTNEGMLNVFDRDIVAQYVRVNVLSYSEYPYFRWELFECEGGEMETIKPMKLGPPNSAIEDTDPLTCTPESIALRWDQITSTQINITVDVIGTENMTCDSDHLVAGISTDYSSCDNDFIDCSVSSEEPRCLLQCSVPSNVQFKLLFMALNREGDSSRQICAVKVNTNNWRTQYLREGTYFEFLDYLDSLTISLTPPTDTGNLIFIDPSRLLGEE